MFSRPILSKPTAIEGFCGAGGLSLGLRQAGFDVRAAFDFDETAVATYRANFGNHVHQLDAYRITGAELLDLAGLKPGELDLYAGGPPCPGFSLQRRRVPGEEWDPRNVLTLHHARIGAEMLPRVVLFENVPALLGPRNDGYIERIQSILFRYRMSTYVLDAWDHGAPQRRRRAVIFFVREDIEGDPIIEQVARRLTVADAIGDLPEPPDDGSEHRDFPHHATNGLSNLNRVRLAHVPLGGSWIDLPPELQLDCHRRYAASGRSGGWQDVYGRMRWNEPAPTLTTGCLSVTKGRFVHPEENRGLTAREAARLQGFPDAFLFAGGRGEVARQIGNAVPVPLGRAIGEAIIQLLPKRPLESAQPSAQSEPTRPEEAAMSHDLDEIERQIAELTRKRDELKERERAAAIVEIRKLMERFGITENELSENAGSDAAKSSGRSVKIKYRHGENAWSGRGKQPVWLRKYLASGGVLDDLLEQGVGQSERT